MKALISDIKRFAVHDGDGIRTTVFFKGCSLKCVWCHNPESIDFKPQLAFYENKCIACGECLNACPNGAHRMTADGHRFDREKCIGCGKCAENCLGDALKLYGREVTVDELLPLVLEDKDFYESSGGGVTLSGGECLCQADFCAEFLKALKGNGINTAVDTCGFVPQPALGKVIPYTDIFLYDIKAIDSEVHKKCTGHTNELILDNLKLLDACGCKAEVRIPFVPQWNSQEIGKIGLILSELKNLTKVRVLPYHSFAGSKYDALQIPNTLPCNLPTDDDIEKTKQLLRSHGLNVVE